MIKKMPVALVSLLVSLSGCAKDYRLAPPVDSEQITVTVKVPEELEAEVMQVMYRSATCKRVTHGASGQRIELEGYHGIDVYPQRQGQSNIYQASLPMDGGGPCKWRLSNVTFGVAYKDPSRFGENVTYGAGGGIVVIFDHNNSPRGGANFEVEGDPIIRKEYYPWLSETFLGGYNKDINLLGEGGIYVKYRALQARQVYFEPVLHSNLMLYSVGVKEKKEGNFVTYTYPDGSVVADGRPNSKFLKLQAIRLAAEGKR
ncbi:hypothetical protein [Pseudomonas sp. RGM2987]|uniref:hypothetical protein n=1 Tax=Pseudomonas sp. RGM2987 TaxID=2930090 RepID=UPI001FD68582|nr:hypothetical protein [Pseudomonas sp. RGM2987]MCJ8204602.1 hypothetical protein [Pseudomonas sp. RGM2987]